MFPAVLHLHTFASVIGRAVDPDYAQAPAPTRTRAAKRPSARGQTAGAFDAIIGLGHTILTDPAIAAVLVNINQMVLNFDQGLMQAWCDYYVAVGDAALALIDVQQAEDALTSAEAERTWWNNWVQKPNNFPPTDIAPPYQYFQVLEDFTQAVVSVAKAGETLYTAAASLPTDARNALKVAFNLDIGKSAQKFTYADPQNAAPLVTYAQLAKIASDLDNYRKLMNSYMTQGYLDGATTGGMSTTFAYAVVTQAADRLNNTLAMVKNYQAAAVGAVGPTQDYLNSATSDLADAQATIKVTRAAIDAKGQKLMPAGWSLAAYQANSDAQNMTVAQPILAADVLGEAKAATIVAKKGVEKAKEYADMASKIGVTMLNIATEAAAGASIGGAPPPAVLENSVLKQAQALQQKLSDEIQFNMYHAMTDQEMQDSNAKIAFLNSQLAEFQSAIFDNAVGLNQLAGEVISLAQTSEQYKADSQQRIQQVFARSAADNVPLDAATTQKLQEINAQADAVTQENQTSLQNASNAVFLTQKTLDAASILSHFKTALTPIVQTALAETAIHLPPPTLDLQPPPEKSSGLWLAAAAAIGAAILGRG